MEATQRDSDDAAPTALTGGSLPLVRSAVAGLLMGLANLVPGISGGTMIVVMGLYDEFVAGLADATRLRFTRRNVTFLGIVICFAVLAIATLAGTMSRTVTLHRSAMFSLFIGMTLGGAPLLIKMIGRFSGRALLGLVIGLALMLVIGLTKSESPDRDAVKAAVAAGNLVITPDYARDVAAGVLGMSAMVLPGISGAYMLLILNRYENILAAISLTKGYVLSIGKTGDLAFLHVIVPTAIGALLSLFLLSNLLKWMLRRHRSATIGLLLGILFGSVVGIWPFDATSQPRDIAVGSGLAIAGFLATVLLSRISA